MIKVSHFFLLQLYITDNFNVPAIVVLSVLVFSSLAIGALGDRLLCKREGGAQASFQQEEAPVFSFRNKSILRRKSSSLDV